MGVKLMQEAENERLANRNLTWEYFSSDNYEETIHKAKDMGWKERRVQVKVLTNGEKVTYMIEPFERDCECPNLLNYDKAFHEGKWAQ